MLYPMQKNLKVKQAEQKFCHDRKSGEELPALQSEDLVRSVKSEERWKYAKIKEKCVPLRSYVIETPVGRTLGRGHRHLFLAKKKVFSTCITIPSQ